VGEFSSGRLTKSGSDNFMPLKLVLVVGISELSVGSEDFTIIEFEIFLTWQPVLMISQIWARLEFHLHISTLAHIVIFYEIIGFSERRFFADYLN
jgi:hypothetical protein